MSPEYASEGLYSTKSDVFSFGVLVLEIVSGKRNRGFNHPDHDLNLLGHVSIWQYFLISICKSSTTNSPLNCLGMDTICRKQGFRIYGCINGENLQST